jgi:hypothetical protein
MRCTYLNRNHCTFRDALDALEKMVEDKLQEWKEMNSGHGDDGKRGKLMEGSSV